jgi:hypothetical protein
VCIDRTNERLLAVDTDGYVWHLEDEDKTKDNGVDVSWEVQSKDFTLSTRAHFPRWVKYDVDASGSATCVGELILDGTVHQLHSITGNRTTKRRLVGTGNGQRCALRVRGTDRYPFMPWRANNAIVPYVEVNGARTMGDDYVRGLYARMVEDGTAKRVFHGGAVKSSDDMVRWMKNPSMCAMLIAEDNEPLLLSWVTGIEDHRGWFSFCVFKKGWGRKKGQELGKMCADYWMGMKDNQGNPVFRVLMGVTPAHNRLALLWVKTVGAESIGTIPDFATNYWTGERFDAVISYIKR